jgi:hypothetical protein
MIRRSTLPDDDDNGGDRDPPESASAQQAIDVPTGANRKPRGVPVPPGPAADMTVYNPTQVAKLWGISHDKVLEFIKTGELRAFNVASKNSRRPQFKIPSAALREFEEQRSGREPARSVPRPSGRRSSRKSSVSPTREYF